jgi:hypothetical protein
MEIPNVRNSVHHVAVRIASVFIAYLLVGSSLANVVFVPKETVPCPYITRFPRPVIYNVLGFEFGF